MQIGSAEFPSLAAALVVAVGGHHHDREIGEALIDRAQQLQASMPGTLMSDKITTLAVE